MKFIADFTTFLREEVNLNRTRLELLEKRVDVIESYIENSSTFGDMFIRAIPAGSWAHRTIIRPVDDSHGFDADLLIELEPQDDWEPKNYINNLYSSFSSSSTYKDKVSKHTRCMRVNYAGDFHIDVVPYMEVGGPTYITNRKDPEDTGKLENSNPEAFNEWIEDRQRFTDGHFIKVVRLVKYLRDFKGTFTCKSIILMCLLGEQVDEIEATLFPERYADVPATLNTLMTKLANWLPNDMPPIYDPAGTGDNFSERYRDTWNYTNFKSRIEYYATKIAAAFSETNHDESISLWREVFGNEFKKNAFTKSLEQLSPYSAVVHVAGEQYIDQPPYSKAININPRYSAKITARVTGFAKGEVRRRRGFAQYTLSRNGNYVAKNRSIVFELITNAPRPYTIYWKVKNGGKEATDIGQPRGEISLDSGGSYTSETTSYTGTHYVECYVVKDDLVVAKAFQPVIVTATGRQ